MEPASQTNEELFRRTVESLNERDFDGFAETHTGDVVLHDHDETLRGVEAAVQQEQDLFDAFPNMEYTLEDVLVEGDMLAGRWRVTGTHKGEFHGIPPTGEEVDIPASGICRVEDGKIAEVWLIYDRLGLLQQLGATELPRG